MDKKKDLVKNTVILAFGKICTQFVNFFLLPFYTVLLTPSEYGIVDLFNTYITLLVPLFNWQFETGLFRFMIDFRDNPKQKKSLFSTVIITNTIQALIYILFYLVFQRFIGSEYKIYLAIDVVLNIFLNTLLQYPRGTGDNQIYSLGGFISALVTIPMNILLIGVFGLKAHGLFLGTVIGKIITIFYLIYANRIWNYFSFKSFNIGLLKDLIRYSVPLIPNQLSWWVVGVSDRTIISKAISVAANGVYSVANKFSTVYITLYNIFNLSWTESVSLHIGDPDSREYIEETINTMFCLFSSICFCIIAVMPFAFKYVVGSEFNSAYNQIPILMIAALFQSAVGLYSVIYVALKKSVEIAKTSFYAALVNIGVNVLLIRYIGLYAASFSTLLAYMSMFIYRYFHVKKYLNVPLTQKNILYPTILGSLVIYMYYSHNLLLNIISFVLSLICLFFMNKSIVLQVLVLIKKYVKKCKRS
ncbi:lipopolysaccharide biosynthesis protein [Sporanaerobacter acetigenes]|uniref:lipopolysaccharide biosynthesis protein n=1 Tax=Sporanaerobacter acetigenes TaxID=165813 RepID=UPI00332F900A